MLRGRLPVRNQLANQKASLVLASQPRRQANQLANSKAKAVQRKRQRGPAAKRCSLSSVSPVMSEATGLVTLAASNVHVRNK